MILSKNVAQTDFPKRYHYTHYFLPYLNFKMPLEEIMMPTRPKNPP